MLGRAEPADCNRPRKERQAMRRIRFMDGGEAVCFSGGNHTAECSDLVTKDLFA